MNLEISDLAGLPAHPLIVHAVVVLVPLSALGLLVSAVWPAARDRIGWITVGLSTFCLVLIPLATGSGENLEERVDETRLVEEHAELAERMLPWVVLLVLAAVALMVFVHVRRRLDERVADGSPAERPGWARIAAPLVVAFAVVASIGSVWVTYEVGHSGARATWDDTPAGEHEGGGEEHEDEGKEGAVLPGVPSPAPVRA